MILDTNAISAIGKRDASIATLLKGQSSLFVPAIVIGEYRFGISGSRKRQETERWFDGFLQSTQTLDVTDETARHYAALRRTLKDAGTPIPENDIWIAALALQFSLPLLSRDTHFGKVAGVRWLQW